MELKKTKSGIKYWNNQEYNPDYFYMYIDFKSYYPSIIASEMTINFKGIEKKRLASLIMAKNELQRNGLDYSKQKLELSMVYGNLHKSEREYVVETGMSIIESINKTIQQYNCEIIYCNIDGFIIKSTDKQSDLLTALHDVHIIYLSTVKYADSVYMVNNCADSFIINYFKIKNINNFWIKSDSKEIANGCFKFKKMHTNGEMPIRACIAVNYADAYVLYNPSTKYYWLWRVKHDEAFFDKDNKITTGYIYHSKTGSDIKKIAKNGNIITAFKKAKWAESVNDIDLLDIDIEFYITKYSV